MRKKEPIEDDEIYADDEMMQVLRSDKRDGWRRLTGLYKFEAHILTPR